MKRCTKCGEVKSLDKFSKCSRARDGYQFWCKDCYAEYGTKWKREWREDGATPRRTYIAELHDRDFLEREYVQRERSLEAIARQLGCSRSTVRQALLKYGISLRPAKKIPRYQSNGIDKKCSKCEEVKSVSEFHKDSTATDGLNNWCKLCAHENYEQHYEVRRDVMLARAVAWQEVNRDKWRSYMRAYNREYWQTPNGREAHRKAGSRRRVRKLGAFVEDVDRQVVFERDEGICHICLVAVDPSNWALDHVIPLQPRDPDDEAGEHSYLNCAVSHLACNAWKNNKPLDAWMGDVEARARLAAMHADERHEERDR